MFTALINHIAILTLLGLSHFLILKKYPTSTYRFQIYSGILFGFFFSYIMMDSFVLSRGFLFDGRYTLPCFAALYGGPITAGITAITACLFRILFDGGEVTADAVIIFLMSTGVGLYFYKAGLRQIILSSYSYTYFLSLAINSFVLFWGYILIKMGQSGEIFQVVTVDSFFLFPIGTVVLGKLLHDQERLLQTTQELHKSEGRYRGLFEKSKAIMFIFDPQDGQIIDVNPAACRFYGYERSTLQKMNLDQVDTLPFPEIQKKVNLYHETQAQSYLFQHRLANGEIRDVEVYAGPLQIQESNLIYSIVFDVTEKKNLESSLKESKERFHKALSESPFPIAIHNEKGDFLFINKVWEELSGYSYCEIPTIDEWSTKVYGDRKELVKKGIDALYGLKDRVDEGEFEIQTKNGEKRIWDFSTAPLGKDKDGLRMVISVAKDVTEHKKVEMHQQRLLTAIEQSQETFLITDTEGTILYVNPSFEKNTGYSSAESLGKTPRILKSGQYDEFFYKNIWEAITQGQTWSGRISNKKNDGTLYYDQTTISPVFDPNGKIVNYVSVKRDVTREIEIENQLRQMQKMDSIGRLAGGIAHDFNNILTAILGYTEFARYKISGDTDLKEDLKQIEKATLRAANLTRQLLAFSRKQILTPVVVDLNELILDLDKMLRRLIGEDIEYTTLPCEGLWKVKADVGQMEQVLTNLVVNARDAMPRGGNITIETQNAVCDESYTREHVEVPVGEYVMLAVSDTGTGIAKDLQDKIFDPFFTTKEMGKGTGLGLSTVHGIIKQSGGNIFVYSEEGHGTTFKIYLPRVVQESYAKPTAPETPESYSGTETVLLVEDEKMLRTLLSKSLRNAGYKILEASYASEAIELFEKNKDSIQILVTDVIMPKMSGKDLAQILAQKNPGLKVLYMSGYTSNAIVHHGILDERVEFIQKPFVPKDLLLKIRSVLDR